MAWPLLGERAPGLLRRDSQDRPIRRATPPEMSNRLAPAEHGEDGGDQFINVGHFVSPFVGMVGQLRMSRKIAPVGE